MPTEEAVAEPQPVHLVDRRRRRTRRRWKSLLSKARRVWILGWLLCAAGLTWLAVKSMDRWF